MSNLVQLAPRSVLRQFAVREGQVHGSFLVVIALRLPDGGQIYRTYKFYGLAGFAIGHLYDFNPDGLARQILMSHRRMEELPSLGDYRFWQGHLREGGRPSTFPVVSSNRRDFPLWHPPVPVAAKNVEKGARLWPKAHDFFAFWRGAGVIDSYGVLLAA